MSIVTMTTATPWVEDPGGFHLFLLLHNVCQSQIQVSSGCGSAAQPNGKLSPPNITFLGLRKSKC